MQNSASVEVIDRFFEGLRVLKEDRIIRGKATFCRMAGANRRNFWQVEQDHTSDAFQTGWLSLLVQLGISPRWLLTGEGDIRSHQL